MSKLPLISGKACVKALEKAGFRFQRQKGSNISMIKENPFVLVVVPDHKEIDRGTLRAIIRQAGLSTEEFISSL